MVDTDDPTTLQPNEPAARWEDYIDVLFSPAELFRRRAHDRLLHPLVTLAIATVVIALLMIPVNARMIAAGAAGDPQAEAFLERFGVLFNVAGALFAPVLILVLVVWAGSLLWAASRALSIDVTFRQALLAATYAAFIYLIAQIIGGALTLFSNSGIDLVRDTSFGVLRFTGGDDMSEVVVQLLRRLDVFVLWQAAVWAIGLAVMGRASAVKAAAAAAIAWLFFAAPGVLLAALGIGPAAGAG